MRAWQVTALGEPADVLRLVELPEPVPGPDQVRVRVEAVGLNFPDVLLCQGRYQSPPPLPFTPGLEVCGTVLDGPRAGERVVAATVLPDGGLAEQVLLPAARVLPVPDDLPSAKAAALLVTYQTGHVGLHRRAQLRAGETLLVHGGAGGVGSAAVQLGRAAGARVIATAGGPDKVQVCKDLGADVVVDHRAEDVLAVVRDVTGGRGADVVFDPVGGDVFDLSRRCVAFEGRLVVVGFAGGRIADAPTNHVLIRSYSVVGLNWALYRDDHPDVVATVHADLLDLWRRRLVDPLVSDVLPLERAVEGLARIADRGVVGKLVVAP